MRNGEINTLGSTMLATFRRCPRQFYYDYILGIEPNIDRPPFRFGTIWHGCMEARNNGASLVEIEKYILACYEAYGQPENVSDYDWELEREILRTLFAGYWAVHAGDNVIVETAEFPFEIPIMNPETGGMSRTFKNTGRIDGIGIYNGERVIVEYKTAGSAIDDERYWLRLRADAQITQYVLGARTLGYDISSVLYDVTRKPTIHPKQIPLLDDEGFKIVLDGTGNRAYLKNGKPRQAGSAADGLTLQTRIETVAEYRSRLARDILERPDYYYQRRLVPRLDDEIEEYRLELHQQSQSIREAIKHGRWFRNVHIFNCPHCDFENICLGGVHLVEGGEAPTGFRYKSTEEK